MPLSNPSSVIVALSGGVDSAVAASLLIEQGHSVAGLFMSNWDEDETGYCTSAADYQDARRVAEELGIPLHRASFAREYRDRVFAHFLDEYQAGRTPNPDVLCNREIKFGACYELASRLGARRFATGHYARVAQSGAQTALLRAADTAKDQTYFLHAIDPALLSNVLFPIGDMRKSEVREYARAHALPVHDKKDSTGICFIGERPFTEFLSTYLPAQPGAIESSDGLVLGRHQGLMYYTLGQRQGLGVGGRRGAGGEPWYVADKDLERNVLIVVQGQNHPRLLSRGLETGQVHWLASGGLPRASITAQIRHRQSPVAVDVTCGPDGSASVTFHEPLRAVAPGQYIGFYAGERCLGGAPIRRSLALLDASAILRTAT
ncbi:MAG TPA: tRNA 2-thiouridine(34) synthase MnmA [Steroidobacteraceae bacterium]|nr:tRNA 2-thiouridine(34) synthase MnmA [Steroidobacteraceae bacterium]